jgi:hypothetical protein
VHIRRLWLSAAAAIAVLLLQSGFDRSRVAAQSVLLTGQVASAEEGSMEGVVVSAKKNGSTITISVISDADGKFSFPAGKLEPGQYALKIRAIGYELDGPKTVDVGSPTTPISIKLRKTRNLAAQLTSGEWVMSVPGTPQQKTLLDRCTSCHTLDRVVKSTYDA